jgi:hypothetical protein
MVYFQILISRSSGCSTSLGGQRQRPVLHCAAPILRKATTEPELLFIPQLRKVGQHRPIGIVLELALLGQGSVPTAASMMYDVHSEHISI